MNIYNNEAAQDGLQPEPGAIDAFTTGRFTDAELRLMMKGKGVQCHIKGALRALGALDSQIMSRGEHKHLGKGLNVHDLLACFAALELLQRKTHDVERHILRAQIAREKSLLALRNAPKGTAEGGAS